MWSGLSLVMKSCAQENYNLLLADLRQVYRHVVISIITTKLIDSFGEPLVIPVISYCLLTISPRTLAPTFTPHANADEPQRLRRARRGP
jgi:hypothetical protein